MASLTYCLYAVIILGLCSATTQPPRNQCPTPCQCQNETITCIGCPKSYITVTKTTQHLYIQQCRDIQYLLRLHQRDDDSKLSLSRLEIKDSFIRQPESFICNDYDTLTLILRNNSINKVSACDKHTNLTFLDLSLNQIERVDTRTFVNMDELQFIDLSENSISEMTNQCFEGLDKLLHLDLSSNNLTYVSDVVFLPLASLQKLNLSSNKLELISERSFSSLLLLQQLDISYNRLTSVAPGALQFLSNLAKLLMTDNPQLRPDAQIFVGTGTRLQQVDASRTGLSQVPEALTHSVRYLTLAGNRIAFVRCGDLDSYPLLHMLDFTDNVIFDIEDDALGRLEMLSQLHLNVNKLTTVPKMLPDKLQYLSMDSNRIRNLTISDFITLTNLKMLLLSNNNISFIQENTFLQLVSLEVLDLSNNPLKALTPNTFSGPASLKDLRIAFVNISPPAKDISFPVPSPEGIENLYLEFSPGLTRQLMADTAALAAMTRLQHLDIRYANVTNLRSDLLHFLPGLKVLRLEGNRLDCVDLEWLGEWMRENPNNNYEQVKCFSSKSFEGKLVKDLEQPVDSHPTLSYLPGNVSNTIDVSIEPAEKVYKYNHTKSTAKAKMKALLNKYAVKKAERNDSKAVDRISVTETIFREAKTAISSVTPSSSNKNQTTTKRPAEYSPKKIDGRSKLLQIFSEWSQEPYNRRYEASQKKYPTTQSSVSPCSGLAGNSNGTEDKTNCTTELPTTTASEEIDANKFMYRKIGDERNNSSVQALQPVDDPSSVGYEDMLKKIASNASVEGRMYADEESNVSLVVMHSVETRMSRFSAEASGGIGALAALGALAAVGAAIAATWAARRQPRPRPQDLMEVPTIAAVGELW